MQEIESVKKANNKSYQDSDIERLLYMVAGYSELTGDDMDELSEDALEMVSAAAAIPNYQNFLRHVDPFKKK